jgi:hypothetical protein
MRPLLLLLLLLVTCHAPLEDEWHILTIKAGRHDPVRVPVSFGMLEGNTLRFSIKFEHDSRYLTRDPRNQWDWNKHLGLMAAGLCDPPAHYSHAMVGWRWIPKEGRFHVGPYVHIGCGGAKHLGGGYAFAVKDGEVIDVLIRNTGFHWQFVFMYQNQVKQYEYPHEDSNGTLMQSWGWFGGDERAQTNVMMYYKPWQQNDISTSLP